MFLLLCLNNGQVRCRSITTCILGWRVTSQTLSCHVTHLQWSCLWICRQYWKGWEQLYRRCRLFIFQSAFTLPRFHYYIYVTKHSRPMKKTTFLSHCCKHMGTYMVNFTLPFWYDAAYRVCTSLQNPRILCISGSRKKMSS